MSNAAADLRSRGYAVIEALLTPPEIGHLRALLLEIVEGLAPPSYWSPELVPLGDRAGVSSSGVFVMGLAQSCPEACAMMLRAPAVAALDELLGEGTHLEEIGVMVSNTERPFFPWHTHIDGLNEGVRLRANAWPRVERPERVLALLYLDDVDEAHGALHIMPRRCGDPSEPPHDIYEPAWPGMVALTPRAGSLVLLEQCTWHAVPPRTVPGFRVIGSFYAAARDAVAPSWADATLRAHPLSHFSLTAGSSS